MWDSHQKNKTNGNKIDSVSVAEEGDHGFIRLLDRAPDNLRMGTETSPQSLSNNDSGIHVRTDFYVGAYGESEIQ